MSDEIVIRFTRDNALALGLLVCRCGHPPNNHFGHDKQPCAHCACKEYREIARGGGSILRPARQPEPQGAPDETPCDYAGNPLPKSDDIA